MPENEILSDLPGGTENLGEHDSRVVPEDNNNEILPFSKNIIDTSTSHAQSFEPIEGGLDPSINNGEEASNSKQFPAQPSLTEEEISQTITIPFRTTSDNWSALEIKPSELGRNLGQEEQKAGEADPEAPPGGWHPTPAHENDGADRSRSRAGCG